MITLTYTVKNGGSGDVGAFTVTDPLGSDLQTIEGNKTLEFKVDGLAAGDTRKFEARVFAVNAGEYSSRAEAKATDSDLSAAVRKPPRLSSCRNWTPSWKVLIVCTMASWPPTPR